MSRNRPWETNIKVPYSGRDYNVIQATWPSGSRALLLQNPETGRVFPATLEVGRTPRHPHEVFVPDADGMVKALEDAGVVKATHVVGRWNGMNVRSCDLVHPELVNGKTPQVLVGYVSRDGMVPQGREQDRQQDVER